ncbi:hypothetical protein PAAG_12526 [Paracoccidioides lutzii Pb01]|uniref:Thiamine pyrophosphate enzyme TPP-binding domain-containing protein n=1 Tax=Paracoccidioides lutzii (strain ATCC MYA-826 / Pb01) TaxID=502779 RepID=A0A0A2UZX8_PARBA|nr:hypothetical protein PAAG_12526 [Paracoccidioides lutzii Pb01]KGQ00798.1 hypothetical protein PAAG_12526 [Paracoccidioides lutzii Pb01]
MEMRRTLPVDLGAVSDMVHDLEWVKDTLSIKQLPTPFEQQPEVNPSSKRLHPYHALKHIFSTIEHGSIIILDGSEAALWAVEVLSLCSPSAVIKSTGNLGFLGNGFGYELGAAIAAPDRKRFDLDIMTIVVNNYCWGMSSNGQELVYGEENPARPISSLSPLLEYDVVAKGMENASAKLEKIEDIEGVIRKMWEVKGPRCIYLIVDDKPIHPLTAAMVGKTNDPNLVVVSHYENVPSGGLHHTSKNICSLVSVC